MGAEETQRDPEATAGAPDPSPDPFAITQADGSGTLDYSGIAPSLPDTVPGSTTVHGSDSMSLKSGDCMGDFVVARVLGKGAFGIVYLARQISLDRLVALKVAANRGSEGRSMAPLEHRNIVQVFSEAVSEDGSQRQLCMQYVAGPSLSRVITDLHAGSSDWTGRDLLAVVDAHCPADSAAFDSQSMRDRMRLGQYDRVGVVCWLGSRLAEALDYAHRKDVLHRDIKPDNILVDQYGHPLLADFNLAFRSMAQGDQELFGGTLGYMSPEHLRAFNPADMTDRAAVTQQSDLYSLGVVLFKTLTGTLPFSEPPEGLGLFDALPWLLERRRTTFELPVEDTAAPALVRTMEKCLAFESGERFEDGAQFGEAMRGCLSLHEATRNLPDCGRFMRAAVKSPFVWLAVLAVMPHLLGSAFNIAYNSIRISLTDDQSRVFQYLLVGYNAIVWPLCLIWLGRIVIPLMREWRKLASADDSKIERFRHDAMQLPWRAGVIAACGWFPLGLLFPLGIDLLASTPVANVTYAHFLVDMTLSGGIALTWSVLAVQLLTVRVLYPRLWADVRDFRGKCRDELSGLEKRVRRLEIMASLIPLVGAAVLIWMGPPKATVAFRLLVISLIALGMLASPAAGWVAGRIRRSVHVMTHSN